MRFVCLAVAVFAASFFAVTELAGQAPAPLPSAPTPMLFSRMQTHPTDPKDPVCYPRGTHPCACRVLCSEGENGQVEFHEDSQCSHFCQKNACACWPEPTQKDCNGSH